MRITYQLHLRPSYYVIKVIKYKKLNEKTRERERELQRVQIVQSALVSCGLCRKPHESRLTVTTVAGTKY